MVGTTLGNYKILEKIGAGGQGTVYKAIDSKLGRSVVIKVLPAELTAKEANLKRFEREARLASSLDHPNICTIFDLNVINGIHFIAMQYIEGRNVRQLVNGRPLGLASALSIAIQVTDALAAAHAQGIIHRDIKAGNVMVTSKGQAKVLDFGLAKLLDEDAARTSGIHHTELTEVGVPYGTATYAAPEQARGGEVDERTDIWSVGVMMYEMIAGAVPFSGATTSHTIVQILEKDPVPLSRVGNAPPELQRIVEKAMAKSVDERYQTAKDMLIDLRSLKKRIDVEVEIQRTSSPTMSIPAIDTQELARQSGKKRVVMFALIGMAIVTAAIFGVNMWRSSRARSNIAVTAPAAPATQRTLTYWITVQKFRDKKPFQEPFTIPGEMIFEEDYQIRLNFSSPQTGHLYILNEGPAATSAPEYNVVFPSPTANNGSSLLAAGQVTQIPDESWLKFDAQQGTEKLWLVFSEDAVPELETLKEFAGPQTQGLITDAARNKVVQNFLTTHSETKPTIEKGERLTTLKNPVKLLVHPIILEHH